MSDSDGEQKPDLTELLSGNNQENTAAGAASSTGSADNKVPKHLRLRYWNSHEEMRLIELWRRYSSEVVTLQKNIPIFRTIMEGMREYGFQVNSQECRRKINTLKNKYIAERRRIENSGNKRTSDWRLYPLIHCLLSPKQKNPDLTHQLKILKELAAKVPDLYTPEPHEISNKPTTPPPLPQPQPVHRRRGRPVAVHSMLKRHFTMERLAQLRVDNKLLTAQRDTAAKQLLVKEQEYKVLESFLMQWQQQQEQLLQRLQRAINDN